MVLNIEAPTISIITKQPRNCRRPISRRSTIGSARVSSQGISSTKASAADNGEADDEARLEPVLALALVEHDLETAEPQRHQHDADPIDLEAAGEALLPLAHQRLRLDQEPLHQCQREHADRHVDEEDPVPGEIVGEPAADRRPDRGRHDDRDTVDREGLGALLRRKRVGQDGLLARHHAAAAQALQDAEEDQERQAGRQPAQQRAHGEQRHAQHVEALASDHAQEPAADRHDHGAGDQIGGDHPGTFVDAGRQAAGDVAQRHIGDRGVEHLHEGGDRDHHRDQPGAAVAGGRPGLGVPGGAAPGHLSGP